MCSVLVFPSVQTAIDSTGGTIALAFGLHEYTLLVSLRYGRAILLKTQKLLPN